MASSFENPTNETVPQQSNLLAIFFEQLPKVEEAPRMLSEDQFESLLESGVTIESVCAEFIKRGYVLHGSSIAGLMALEPRQARDEGGHHLNVRNAVYASTDARIPIFMAIVSQMKGRASYNINTTILEDGTETETIDFSTDFAIPEDKLGYVYVLPAGTFENAGGTQLTSSTPVKPAYIIPVRLKDFTYKINKIEEN